MLMETNVSDIATLLEVRRSSSSRTVLFLGARAGGLFYNTTFHECVEKFSKRLFSQLSETAKFHECYKILSDTGRFSENDVYDILALSLKNLQYRREDDCLVELIKEDFFDIVISTSVDDLLDNAFDREEMRSQYDFDIWLPERNRVEDIMYHKTKYCMMLKVFGDLGSRQYKVINNEFDLDNDPTLKAFLEKAFSRHVLMIGYDPVWDRTIERAFSTRGDDIWFVNEDKPPEASWITHVMEKRKGKYFTGNLGNYRRFTMALHSQLLNRNPLRYEAIRQMSTQLQEIQEGIQSLQADVAKLLEAKEVI